MRVDIYEGEEGGPVVVAADHKPPVNVLPAPPRGSEAQKDFSCPCNDCKRKREKAQEQETFRVKAEQMRRTDPSYATACETLETLKSIDTTLKLLSLKELPPATPAKRPARARSGLGGGG